MSLSFSEFVTSSQQRLEKISSFYLEQAALPAPTLGKAMAYSVMQGGKRIRPLLVYATGYAFNTDLHALDAAACAIELIHTYSLIHDDLPAMDNSDLRRGTPTSHKKFGEAMAILAGDALQPLAFEILATHPAPLTAEQRIAMVKIVSTASGANGMVAGQVLDITGIDSLKKITLMYQLKSGALLTASVKLAIAASNLSDQTISVGLEKFANNISLAFQLQDDLLDIETETSLLGKPQGLDAINGKKTYPILVGVEQTRHKIQSLFSEGVAAISCLGERAIFLKELSDYLKNRSY